MEMQPVTLKHNQNLQYLQDIAFYSAKRQYEMMIIMEMKEKRKFIDD